MSEVGNPRRNLCISGDGYIHTDCISRSATAAQLRCDPDTAVLGCARCHHRTECTLCTSSCGRNVVRQQSPCRDYVTPGGLQHEVRRSCGSRSGSMLHNRYVVTATTHFHGAPSQPRWKPKTAEVSIQTARKDVFFWRKMFQLFGPGHGIRIYVWRAAVSG